ncbi:hypothetical protein MASR1M60_19530 [Rhodocyclaceae bacterium]
MKLLMIAAVAGATLYATGGAQKAQAIWYELKAQEQRAEMAALLKRRDEIFASTYQMPDKCVSPKSSLQQLECKNERDNAKRTFDARFAAKVAEGWRPEQM